MLVYLLMGRCRERERERDIMRASGISSMDNGYSELEQHDGLGSPSTDYSSSSSRSSKNRNLESRYPISAPHTLSMLIIPWLLEVLQASLL